MPIPQLGGTWLLHTCDMTPRYVWHTCEVTSLYTPDAPFMPQLWGTWLLHTCDMTHPMCYMTHHMCDMTYSYVWHDSQSFSRVLCNHTYIHMCDMTHSYVWHESLTCVTWLIYMCDMTHHMCDMTHNSSRASSETICIHICDITHPYVYTYWHVAQLYMHIHLWHNSLISVPWLAFLHAQV